jgi:N6-adenosine-specific RNA methylase IME4
MQSLINTAAGKQAQGRGTELVLYDTACRTLAEAKTVDEVKHIRNTAVAMAAYARQAKNRDLEADALEIRMRATRRLAQMLEAQKESVGLAKGGGGKHGRKRVIEKPTLASQNIDKNLAQQVRVLGRLSDEQFESKVMEARASVSRVFRRAVREVEIAQEREERRAKTSTGGTVADLHALIASGYRAGSISADPAWPFTTFSERASRALTDHYDTMTIDEIKALPVAQLAAADCALFLWVTWPNLPVWHEVIEAWGFCYSGLAFDWIKLNPSGEGLHWGTGYGTRANPEPCLLARRGKTLRLDHGVHSVIMAPVGAHSEKPEEAYRRIGRLYPGPYLELFARRPRAGWTTWGDELPRTDPPDPSPTLYDLLSAYTHVLVEQGQRATAQDPVGTIKAGADTENPAPDDGLDIPGFLLRPLPEPRP